MDDESLELATFTLTSLLYWFTQLAAFIFVLFLLSNVANIKLSSVANIKLCSSSRSLAFQTFHFVLLCFCYCVFSSAIEIKTWYNDANVGRYDSYSSSSTSFFNLLSKNIYVSIKNRTMRETMKFY